MHDRRALILGASLLVGGALALLARRTAASVAPADAIDSALTVPPWSFADSVASVVDTLTVPVLAIADVVEAMPAQLTGQGWAPPGRAAPYLAAIDAAERANGIPHNLLARQLYEESSYLPGVISGARRSGAGAIGIAQFIPATAADLGIDPTDAFASIAAAGRYMGQLHRRFGNWSDALAAYNWGQGNVSKKGIAAAPLETRHYVASITGDVAVA